MSLITDYVSDVLNSYEFLFIFLEGIGVGKFASLLSDHVTGVLNSL